MDGNVEERSSGPASIPAEIEDRAVHTVQELRRGDPGDHGVIARSLGSSMSDKSPSLHETAG